MEKLWSAKEVAEFVGRSEKWVYRKALEKQIPCISLSKGTLRFSREDIISWVESRKTSVDESMRAKQLAD